jgi:hypothetical protein
MNKNTHKTIALLFLSLFSSCELFEKEESTDIVIKTEFLDTQFSGSFFLDDVEQPLTGAFVHITKNGVFNDVIINLAPYGSSGSVAFPGKGWLQIRLNPDAKPGNLGVRVLENNFTTAGSDKLDAKTAQGIYIHPNGRNYEMGGSINLNKLDINYVSEQEFSVNIDIVAKTFFMNSQATKLSVGEFDINISASKKPGADNIGSGNTGGGSSSGINCSGGYQGPEFDIQIDSQCQAAFAYKCAGNTAGVTATCKIYNTYRQNDPKIPKCPYCN